MAWLEKRLRGAKLLRFSAGSESLELYHDRIRESLAAAVPPERRAKIHRALASALEAAGVKVGKTPSATAALAREILQSL